MDPEDVNFTLKTYEDILSIDTTKLKFGQYVWIGFFKQSWNIYKHVKTELKIYTVAEQGNDVIINTNVPAVLAVDDIISVTIPQQNSTQLFKVKSVALDKITCAKNGATQITSNDGSSYGFLGKFVSAKLSNLQAINAKALEFIGFKDNDLFWIENNNLNDWAVLKNKKTFIKHQQILNYNTNITITKITTNKNQKNHIRILKTIKIYRIDFKIKTIIKIKKY